MNPALFPVARLQLDGMAAINSDTNNDAIGLDEGLSSDTLSRRVHAMDQIPTLRHSLRQSGSSVLSEVSDENRIYSGSHGFDISVWDRTTFLLEASLRGHTAGILALERAPEKMWLFSSSGDSTVRIWSTRSLACLYIVNPFMDAGDIFALAWSSCSQSLFLGCQNTSIQSLNCSGLMSGDVMAQTSSLSTERAPGTPPADLSTRPTSTKNKVHKFFNSYPQYERRAADAFAVNGIPLRGIRETGGCAELVIIGQPITVDIPSEGVVDSAHYGYVYAMAVVGESSRDGCDDILPETHKGHLVTGSGDETLKLWKAGNRLELAHTFDGGRGAILSVATRGDTAFAGCQDGYVMVWDLETKTLVRAIIVQECAAVLSLSLLHSDIYTGSEDGRVRRFSATFDCTASWTAHEGIVLSSVMARHGEGFELITGGGDGEIKIWEIFPPEVSIEHKRSVEVGQSASSMDDTLSHALSSFVSFRSVSGADHTREHCRQAAIWLRRCLVQLGADASLLPTGERTNPLVLATFTGSASAIPRPRILYYGHYDVISAPSNNWDSDPFTLAPRNGYLYGRGVTDNKGPIMAVACAAAELLSRRALGVDLVFLIEGEEENGSGGFEETVKQHREQIGHIDAVLVSNSTWISENAPCITYGLRGVVHCALQITNGAPDMHSGVEGGAINEPMFDMVKVLSSLTDAERRVLVPGFYDLVRAASEDERQLYQILSRVTQRPASSLSARWREPSLTIHKIEVSGPNNSTVIPGTVTARVSVRIVPDQDVDVIAASLVEHLEGAYATMGSPNRLTINVEHTADWWLGELDGPWFKALEAAVRDEWGVEPLHIREGGSIPSVPFLEKEFKCHALHLPMGQSSDQAHLPNERIALSNLKRGKSVVERFLSSIAAGVAERT